jgi:hypothetical protein
MSTTEKSVVETRADRAELVFKDVKSAALEDAIAKAKPSPWTRSMFMVSLDMQVDMSLLVSLLTSHSYISVCSQPLSALASMVTTAR